MSQMSENKRFIIKKVFERCFYIYDFENLDYTHPIFGRLKDAKDYINDLTRKENENEND